MPALRGAGTRSNARGGGSELIILRDERAQIGEEQHQIQRDQEADQAEGRGCLQVGIVEAFNKPIPCRRLAPLGQCLRPTNEPLLRHDYRLRIAAPAQQSLVGCGRACCD